ncbi:MAG: hypothetical protein Q4G26_08595 [Paracoccus sp. (in: a-proteobacteria)]|nr:hypothetical protein [Paracoccus sp. (in: a-proteobacteria)]
MPGGLLFIIIRFSPLQITVLVLVLVLVVVSVVLAVGLPLLALLALSKGQGRRAAWLGGAGLLAVGYTLGPGLYEGMQAGARFRALEGQQVTRATPDLTGRVVAFVSWASPGGDSRQCPALLKDSGADTVYLITPFPSGRFLAGDYLVDLARPFDLAALITHELRLASRASPYPGAEDEIYCAHVPLPETPRAIDYFIMEDAYSSALALFPETAALRMDEVFVPAFDLFFGPVDDPSAYRPSPENADLLRFQAYSRTYGIPFTMFRTSFRSTPGHWYDPEVTGALCRHGPEDCLRR